MLAGVLLQILLALLQGLDLVFLQLFEQPLFLGFREPLFVPLERIDQQRPQAFFSITGPQRLTLPEL